MALLLCCCSFQLSSFHSLQNRGQTRKQRWTSLLEGKIMPPAVLKLICCDLPHSLDHCVQFSWNGNTSLGPINKVWQNWDRKDVFTSSTIIFAPSSFYINMHFSIFIGSVVHYSSVHSWFLSPSMMLFTDDVFILIRILLALRIPC